MTIRSFLNYIPKIGARTYIDEQALVSGQVEIGEDASVWPMAVIRGDVHSIKIGDRTNIQDGSCCHVTHDSKHFPHGFPLIIGSDVTIGHKVTLHGCMIGDHCLIGIDSTVLDGAIIEPRVMLGAGSLVPPGKVLESGYLYIGRPAMKKRALTKEELEFLSYNVNHYVILKNKYLSAER